MLFRHSRILHCASSTRLITLATSSLNNNLPDKALQYLDEVKKTQPSFESVDYLRALAFAQKNDPFAARQSALEELRHHPSNIDAQDFSRILRQQLSATSLSASSSLSLPYDLRQSEPDFAMCYDALLDHTMLDKDRLFSLWKSTREVFSSNDDENNQKSNQRNLIVECGTAGGGSLLMMGCSAAAAATRSGSTNRNNNAFTLVSFDTFTGMPPPSDKDKRLLVSESEKNNAAASSSHWADGTCSSGGSEEQIKRLARAFSLEQNLVTVPGLFENTLEQYVSSEDNNDNNNNNIKMLHIDCDWYESTKQCLEVLWPRLEVGGKFQIDDFLYWDGCRQAVQEFFSTLKVEPKCSLSSVALCGTKMG